MRNAPLAAFAWLIAGSASIVAAGEGTPPRIVAIMPSVAQVELFDALELAVKLEAQFKNPYDPDEIDLFATVTDPAGRERRVNGFLYQDYERTLDDGREVLTPKGERAWKILFAPQTVGRHRYHVSLRTRDGLASGGGGFFIAKPSKRPGFVGVSARNPRYFAFSTGKPFFPIGHNISWVDSKLKTFDYDRYFRKMAAAHENFTRIWMASWSLELEGKKLDDYRLDNAWRLDHILRFARTYGIVTKLCFDNFYDFSQKRHGPYWAANGGLCHTPRCFFTKAAAKQHYRRRLRYIVARWGHSPQIMAWEFWNEMDYAPSDRGRVLSRKEPYMLEWTAEMGAELRRLDPYGHLVTNSLAAYTDWPEFWALPAIDFVQLHSYIYDGWEPSPLQGDAAALLLDQALDFEDYEKPFLVAEFGFHGSGGTNRLNKLDKLGIHLHNALWASCLSGAAGAPMLWWWDDYVDPNDLYYHYRALGRFLKDVDWAGQAWRPIRDEGKDDLRIVGLRTDTQALLWFQDRRNTWQNRLEKKQPPQLLAPFTVPVALRPGGYRVTWFDAYNGNIITQVPAEADAAGLRLTLSCLVKAPDVACRIERAPERP